MLATVHPSYMLGLRDDDDRRAQVRRMVADLRPGLSVVQAAT